MFKSCVSKHTQGLGVGVVRVLLSGGGFWQLPAIGKHRDILTLNNP